MPRLNGPQTTGRAYRDLSPPRHGVESELDVPIAVRDGTRLLADVHRPAGAGPVPALLAFSCYPRQMQQSGLPSGFVEAGSTPFWASRGYAHVIVNARGTGGSGGTYTLLDATERDDLHDVVEWIAAQPWCDGGVGMIGISCFAMAQLMAAAATPPSLRAIFPLAGATGIRQALYHGGILSDRFAGAWLGGVGMLAQARRADAFRSRPARALERVMHSEPVHRRLAGVDGEAAIGALGRLMRLGYDAEPWQRLYDDVVAGEPEGSAFWRDRDSVPLLGRVRVPVYVGGGWDNVPLHLPGAFAAWAALPPHPGHRMALLGPGGLGWPWESMHEEALAWYDHWLKGRDTGVLDGLPIRYWLRGADRYRTLDAWPPPAGPARALHLRADGTLGATAGTGGRTYQFLPPGLTRPPNALTVQPASLVWETALAPEAFEVVGAPVLELDAEATAPDVDWIAKLSLVDASGAAHDLTQGWLRTRADAGPWRIELVPTAVRVRPGEALRLTLASDDRHDDIAMLGFTHLPLGTPSRQHVRATSRLVLPLLDAG